MKEGDHHITGSHCYKLKLELSLTIVKQGFKLQQKEVITEKRTTGVMLTINDKKKDIFHLS